jgi:alkylation response protein AidB-like acyl-CoA dehydrogenase
MGVNFYKRDDRDVRFTLKEHLRVERLLEFDKYREFSLEDFDMALDQAQRVAKEVMAPTFQDGDREGCRYENGKVFAPSSFHGCWKAFKEGGWFALTQGPEYGGQGLPHVVAEAAKEFFMSANFAFACYSGMGPGNGAMIENFGSEVQKKLFLEKLYDGTWCACMCLTEPNVGSDAHEVSVKAVPDGEFYKIRGMKTFITSGDHDLAENIIHLVIARIEGAPAGAKGVSLFAVPKIWVHDDGSLGEDNDVACAGIERKMGLHGSATCVMSYGDHGRCRGRLIGEPGRGLAYMFQMVNLARLAVGLESVAFGANVYANALAYAKERVQGVPFGSAVKQRVRIVEHADVRRMLMNLKALTEGMRALVYKAYFLEDIAELSSDPEERAKAGRRVEFFTPIIKAYCSDRIFEMGREGIQILGGYGYCKEYPIEQYTRDCKILSIWDGTNYIQSMDLIARKMLLKGGPAFHEWVDEVRAFVRLGKADARIAEDVGLIEEALDCVTTGSAAYAEAENAGNTDFIALTATRFLDCCAEIAISHLLMEQALIAMERLTGLNPEHPDALFYGGKIDTARYYVRNFLPNVFGRNRMFALRDLSAVHIPEACL